MKKIVSCVVKNMCTFSGIKGSWVMMKDPDGVFRLYSEYGGEISDDVSFRNITEYLGEVEKFDRPIFVDHNNFTINFAGKLFFIHIPIMEGNILNGVLTLACKSRKCFYRYGIENFEILSSIISQAFLNTSKTKEIFNTRIQAQKESDFIHDELTYTNIRLIDKVKELKSLYNLIIKVFTATNSRRAAQHVFEGIKEILKTDESLYFTLQGDRFRSVFSTHCDMSKSDDHYDIPLSFLSHNKGMMINNASEIKELKKLSEEVNIKQILISPARVGNVLKGIIVTGVRSVKKNDNSLSFFSEANGKQTDPNFTERTLELLLPYSGFLAQYIERNHLLEKIVDSNIHLKELNKTKDKFIALISHELRTPLTSIRGFSEMLLYEEAGKLSEVQRDFVKTVLISSEKLENTIAIMIDIADFHRGKMKLNKQKIKWSDLVKEVCREFENDFEEKNIKFTVRTEKNIGRINIDSFKIKKVLNEVISNAVKFTSPGGKVDVGTVKCGDYIEVTIKDTGVGISGEMVKKIFEEFEQVQDPLTRDIDGLGLGLTLCEIIIESHSGRINISSTPGVGTEVSFILPIRRVEGKG